MILVSYSEYGVGFDYHVWHNDDDPKTEFTIFWTPDETKLDEDGEGVFEELLEKGEINFEDGWLKLFKKHNDALAYMYEKVQEKHQEAEWEDGRRYEEYQRANKAEAELKTLRTALCDALGDNVEAIAKAVA